MDTGLTVEVALGPLSCVVVMEAVLCLENPNKHKDEKDNPADAGHNVGHSIGRILRSHRRLHTFGSKERHIMSERAS